MADYEPVRKALGNGLDPAMLCQTCPWNRPCIEPPEMTLADIQARLREGQEMDVAARETDASGGGLPVGTLMAAVIFGGRDTAAQVCPVFALRLRSSAGRGIADSIRASMQGWDDQR